jgi:excisionase family DNA binding protein
MLLCCEGIFFFIGLTLVVTGRLTVNRRRLTGQRVRMAGWVLMSPPIITMFIGSLIPPPAIDANATIEEMVSEILPEMLPLALLELVILLGAIGLAGWLLAQAAKENPPQEIEIDPLLKEMEGVLRSRSAQQPVQQSNVFGNVMTVAEAAAYLRVSEDEVLELINTSQLAAARIGDQYRIARRAIDDYLTRDSSP